MYGCIDDWLLLQLALMPLWIKRGLVEASESLK